MIAEPATTTLIRAARLDDIEAIVALHRIAFADKFGGAFGVQGGAKGEAALVAAWRRQGPAALRGMLVAEQSTMIIGTAALRVVELQLREDGAAEHAFQQILGPWGALRSLFALSLLDHQIARDEAFITDVAVQVAYRRRGIARTLLEAVEHEARRYRKRYLGLYVSATNHGALQLYHDLGFRRVQTRYSFAARLLFRQWRWFYLQKPLDVPI